MKGLTWLRRSGQEHAWWQVTRDERYFCAELFARARADLPGFVTHLNEAHSADLDPSADWELVYEAVLYRDVRHHRGATGPLFSRKRTFDLALFSSSEILIIEAKAQQGFDRNQLADFANDAAQVRELTGVARVRLGALVSSRYRPSAETLLSFDGPYLTWAEMAGLYGGDERLLRADELYAG